MPLYVAVLTFTEDKAHLLQVRPRHREYLKELLEAGKLHESGPFADDSGGVVVYDAADEAELDEIVANDPYTSEGIVVSRTIKEWNLVLSRHS